MQGHTDISGTLAREESGLTQEEVARKLGMGTMVGMGTVLIDFSSFLYFICQFSCIYSYSE